MRKYLVALALVLTLPAISEAGCKRAGIIAQIKQNVQERRQSRQDTPKTAKVTVTGFSGVSRLVVGSGGCSGGKCGLGVIK